MHFLYQCTHPNSPRGWHKYHSYIIYEYHILRVLRTALHFLSHRWSISDDCSVVVCSVWMIRSRAVIDGVSVAFLAPSVHNYNLHRTRRTPVCRRKLDTSSLKISWFWLWQFVPNKFARVPRCHRWGGESLRCHWDGDDACTTCKSSKVTLDMTQTLHC